MLCPFCLKGVKFKQEQGAGRVTFVYRCPEPDCKEQVPVAYVQDYAQYPPVVVSAIGFRGHGKTVYFATLFHALKKLSPARYWREFYTMGLDEADLDTIYGNVTMLENGELRRWFSPPDGIYGATAQRIRSAARVHQRGAAGA